MGFSINLLSGVAGFYGLAQPMTTAWSISYPHPSGGAPNQPLHRTAAQHVSGELGCAGRAAVGELSVSFMDHVLQNIAVCSFLVGVLPVLFARGSRARFSAILFACISVGLGLYFLLSGAAGSGSGGWRRAGFVIVAALLLAYVSLIVTFRVDKNHETKS
jgi:hypothetical protein